MDHDAMRAVPEAARRAAREAGAPLLLAVSGGLDSMALLAAMAAAARPHIAGVATFDHGTGRAATVAAAHVARAAAALGLTVVVGHRRNGGRATDGDEALWRHARLAFLSESAASLGARIATAHTADDQIETVLMRVLRGAGARGLAGLAASSPIVRPFLGLRRADLERYVEAMGVEWVEDPGNRSPRHLRNRVRHDLLPALRRVDPGMDEALLRVGREAAAWRAGLEVVVDRLAPRVDAGELGVASAELDRYDRDSLAILWGALAGRVGLALDRRGTERVTSFIMKRPRGGSVPLAGGWCLEASRDAYILRRPGSPSHAPALLPASGSVEWGRFRFRVAGDPVARDPASRWTAALPADAGARVRGWTAGDRLAPAGGQPRRRVTRYLSDAGLHGRERASWPVVESGAGGEVVWIPGVRRSDAATERSGRPVRHYVCERIAP